MDKQTHWEREEEVVTQMMFLNTEVTDSQWWPPLVDEDKQARCPARYVEADGPKVGTRVLEIHIKMQTEEKPTEDRGDKCYDQKNSHKIASWVEAHRTRWSIHMRNPAEALKASGSADDGSGQASFTTCRDW